MVAGLLHGRPAEAFGRLMVRYKSMAFSQAAVNLSGAVLSISGLPKLTDVAFVDLLGARVRASRRGTRFTLKIISRSRDAVSLSFSKEDLMSRWWLELKNAAERQIERNYELLDFIGGGQYSRVVAGRERAGKCRKVAIKIIDKLVCSPTEKVFAQREYNVMWRSLSPHPNIVETFDVYETMEFWYIVLPLAHHGSVRDFLDSTPQYVSENSVASLTRGLSLALHEIHSKGIVHRDVKLDNILMFAPENLKRVKLADFGYAVDVTNGDYLRAMVGTPGYFPPEMLRRELYSFPADMWSFGVCLYELLTKQFPFGDSSLCSPRGSHISKAALRQVRDGCFCDTSEAWCSLSRSAQSLIRSLLVPEPTKRLCPLGVLAHPFVYSRKRRGGLKHRRSFRAFALSIVAAVKLISRSCRQSSPVSEHSRDETTVHRVSYKSAVTTTQRRRSIGWHHSNSTVSSADECGRRLRDSLSDDMDQDDVELNTIQRRSFGSTRSSHDFGVNRGLGSVRDSWRSKTVYSVCGHARNPEDNPFFQKRPRQTFFH